MCVISSLSESFFFRSYSKLSLSCFFIIFLYFLFSTTLLFSILLSPFLLHSFPYILALSSCVFLHFGVLCFYVFFLLYFSFHGRFLYTSWLYFPSSLPTFFSHLFSFPLLFTLFPRLLPLFRIYLSFLQPLLYIT